VDWENNRFTVRASKTEHHADGGVRIVPLFPELRPLLLEVFEQATEGATHVITRYRDPAANLRTQLVRYMEKAGLKPWPKPWQNLRASRATELADEFPSHVCTAWLGHTEDVANEFYRQVTDTHFAKAVKTGRQTGQYTPEKAGTGQQRDTVPSSKTADFQTVSDSCRCLPMEQLGAEGFEPPTEAL
jgi:integrase